MDRQAQPHETIVRHVLATDRIAQSARLATATARAQGALRVPVRLRDAPTMIGPVLVPDRRRKAAVRPVVVPVEPAVALAVARRRAAAPGLGAVATAAHVARRRAPR